MKVNLVLGAMTATGLAQSAQFTNTSFAGPFTTGQHVPIMWNIGSGLPVTLSVFNSSWTYQIFDNRTVLPAMYDWVIGTPLGFVSGNYQLALEQVNGGASTSPIFGIVVSNNTNTTTTTTTTTTPFATATMTFVYWDDSCGCTKTGTAVAPLNTSVPMTTSWWDEQCGCHQSTVIPVSTMTTANYSVTPPAIPPLMTASATTASPAPTTSNGSSPMPAFKGEAVRLGSSMFGMIALVAAMACF